MSPLLKGIHYRNYPVYRALTFLKLGRDYNERFRIAARYIRPRESVLDVCSGTGEFRGYLPRECAYSCVEASPEFCGFLSRRNIRFFCENLHRGIRAGGLKFDVLVMIISLCHFRDTSLETLVESFKGIAGRVVIVEDVGGTPFHKNAAVRRALLYLYSTDYCASMQLFDPKEFESVMHAHGYACERHSERYMVGYYAPS